MICRLNLLVRLRRKSPFFSRLVDLSTFLFLLFMLALIVIVESFCGSILSIYIQLLNCLGSGLVTLMKF